jgi:hypothetical protein
VGNNPWAVEHSLGPRHCCSSSWREAKHSKKRTFTVRGVRNRRAEYLVGPNMFEQKMMIL